MTLALPDLGPAFTVQPITAGNLRTDRAVAGRFTVTPGVYVLSAADPVDVSTLPAYLGHLRFTEYHAPPPDSLAPSVQSLAAPEYLTERSAELRAQIVDRIPPDSVKISIRPTAGGTYRGFAMQPAGGYVYAASIPAMALQEGPYEFVITLFRGHSSITNRLGLLPLGVLEAGGGQPANAAAALRPRPGRRAADLHPYRRRRAARALPPRIVGSHGPARLPPRAAPERERHGGG
jgi:hypothetical protein